MRHIVLMIGLLVFYSISSTEQVQDKFVFEKDTFFIDSPFDRYDDADFSDRILKINKYIQSSGCWRGIICTWTITNDSLFVIDAVSAIDHKKISFKDLFDIKSNRYFCSWYSGEINFPSKYIICADIHWDRFSDKPQFIYDFDYDFKISKGKLINYSKKDNRRTQIGRHKNLESIYTEIQRYLAVDYIYSSIEFEISFDSDSVGKLNNIQITGIEDLEIKSNMLNALKGFEGLPVYYRQGKMISNSYKSKYELIGR